MRTTWFEQLRFARLILHELGKQRLSVTQLERVVLRKLGTHAKFAGMFPYLRRRGLVCKVGDGVRSPYDVTEAGRRLLDVLDVLFAVVDVEGSADGV